MIFVFGSNLAGIHGAGAAKEALRHYGAICGNGRGAQGNSYAIPTKDEVMHTLSLKVVEAYIWAFLCHARAHPQQDFQVTRVGCGLAGFHDAEVAPLFASAPDNCLFDTAWLKYLPEKRSWGTF